MKTFMCYFVLLLLAVTVEIFAAEREATELKRLPRLQTSTVQNTQYNTITTHADQNTIPATSKTQTLQQVPQTKATQPPLTQSKHNNSPYGTTYATLQEDLQPPSANAGHFIFQQSPIPATQPILMHILAPASASANPNQQQPSADGHNQQQQVQYVQFFRPIFMPILPHSFVHPSLTPPPPIPQASAIAQQYTPTTSSPYLSPAGAFSNPIPAYYHPRTLSTNRFQIIDSPTNLHLNTNEYMPRP